MHRSATAVNSAMCFAAADLLTLAEEPLHSRWHNKSEQDREAGEWRSWQAGEGTEEKPQRCWSETSELLTGKPAALPSLTHCTDTLEHWDVEVTQLMESTPFPMIDDLLSFKFHL